MDRRSFLAAAASGAAFGLAPVLAAAQTYAAELTRDERRLVEQATLYLQNLSTARGRFVQTNSRGASSSGTLYLNRPGKARFEYDAPAQMVVVADGKNVSVYDRRLKTFDRYPLNATPLGIFLARRIRLDAQVLITRFARNEGGFTLTLKDARGVSRGSLVLDFQQSPMALRGWTVVDGQNVQTRVRLSGLEPASALDEALFTLQDPRKSG